MPKLNEDVREMIAGVCCGVAIAVLCFFIMDVVCKMLKL
jgi:hypothetical protein